MGIYRHQMEWASITGLSADKSVNTFHSDSASDAAAISFAQDLTLMFGQLFTGQNDPVSAYFGNSVSSVTNAHTIRTYDLSDPIPRAPIAEQQFSRATIIGSTTSMPRETAICVSYQGAKVSGLPQARRRGRFFVGPLNSAATTSDAPTGDLRPSPDFLQDMTVAVIEFLANLTPEWVVYSPTNDDAVVVTDGWIDNALDTIRSRGQAPTLKLLWP